jgi:hypothetical protein
MVISIGWGRRLGSFSFPHHIEKLQDQMTLVICRKEAGTIEQNVPALSICLFMPYHEDTQLGKARWRFVTICSET